MLQKYKLNIPMQNCRAADRRSLAATRCLTAFDNFALAGTGAEADRFGQRLVYLQFTLQVSFCVTLQLFQPNYKLRRNK